MSTNSELALDQLTSQMLGHFERFKGVATLRGRLDLMNPMTLATLAGQGVNTVKASFAGSLRADTIGLLDEWLNVVSRALEGGRAAWSAVDAYERRGLLDGVLTGATSQETQVGAALGSLFGPIGTMVGGAIGGIVAGGRIDEQAQAALAELEAWWEQCWVPVDALTAGALRANLERDLDAPPQLTAGPTPDASAGSGCLVLGLGAALVLGLVVAVGWWIRSGDSDSGQSQAASAATTSRPAPSASAASSDTPAPIIGTWVSGAGDEITAMPAGKAIALVVKKPAAGARYLADETVATLFPTGDASTFTAEVLVRPSLPPGMKLDAAAAARCQELWTEARGRPLAARLDGRRLVVDVVKLAVDAGALELAAGRVVGCRKFDDTKAARAVLTLTRR